MRRLFALTILVCLAAVNVTWGTGPNVVLNGDFEAGYADFTTDYTYVPPPLNPFSLFPEGYCTVDSDPHNGHQNFWSFGDHTSGTAYLSQEPTRSI